MRSHEDKIKKTVEYDQQFEKPCIICQTPTRNRGVLKPSDKDKDRLLTPENKTRLIIYPLCDNHERNDELYVEIERRIFQQFQ